jgi:DNA helicase II / ATP-dependent DNA helicase PcrA
MTYTPGPLAPYTLTSDGRELAATDEQSDIIDFVLANPRRHVIINALAGAAKTSTLKFLCKYLPIEPTLSVAFNKRIADEMAKVLPGHVRCATMNSVGHRVWAAATGKRLILETKKNYNLTKNYIDSQLKGRDKTSAWDIFGDITKTISRAKLSGYVPSGTGGGRSILTEEDFFASLEEAPDQWFIGIVNHCLREGIAQAYGGLIDFDDQIYMPTLFGGSFPSHRRVMVDETQDLSPLNHAMITKLVGPSTQLIAVGDPWQSIYAFRGADTKSMAGMRERFDMHEMTLSISFRCPRSVVRNAHDRVPHMRWPEWAIEGTVEALPSWSASDIPDNSAIICRNNAPLLSTALALLKARRGVHLVGTDLGPQLVKTLKKLSPNPALPRAAVHEAIDAWEQEKMRKARDSGTIADRAECLRVFANFGETLGAAITYCELLFSAKGHIQLLSGHKAKGLEWDTVYHLDPHRIPSPWAKEGEALEQELNVRYVIETRPKKALFLVRLEDLEATEAVAEEAAQ